MAATTKTISYLSLGSNLGDREGYLRSAAASLHALPRTSAVRLSSVYETAPVGLTDQPAFLNMVVELRTRLTARELLRACQKIESELGRTRDLRWGPRTIDLDILLYGDLTCAEDDLQVPHPRMLEREFVLVPLAEIAPNLILPDGHSAATSISPVHPGVIRRGPLLLSSRAGC
jgi:2-amino-4-hydroxy-6-hydroxymethyldihydropteridine diphosphokinase